MKYILTAILMSLSIGVQAQSLSIGSSNLHANMSANNVSFQVSETAPIFKMINVNTSIGIGGVGITQKETVSIAVIPSVKLGFDVPVSDIKIGFYSGYESWIYKGVEHRFVPLSVMIKLH